MYNFFYYKNTLTTFGPKVLSQEILALNSLSAIPLTRGLLKQNPLFFLKDTRHGPHTLAYFNELKDYHLNTFFVVDLNHFKRTVFYLKITHGYTLGLVASTQNP